MTYALHYLLINTIFVNWVLKASSVVYKEYIYIYLVSSYVVMVYKIAIFEIIQLCFGPTTINNNNLFKDVVFFSSFQSSMNHVMWHPIFQALYAI
jgi:hypothetical protein